VYKSRACAGRQGRWECSCVQIMCLCRHRGEMGVQLCTNHVPVQAQRGDGSAAVYKSRACAGRQGRWESSCVQIMCLCRQTGEMGVQLLSIHNLALEGGGSQPHTLPLNLREQSSTHCKGSRVGPRTSLDSLENVAPLVFNPRTVQPIATVFK
jgi:hypothetical protein